MNDPERHVGFTGTRLGMTLAQFNTLASELRSAHWVHHGDCVGSDHEAHKLARRMGKKIAVHPPIENRLRANCTGDDNHEPKNYIARNHDIVDATAALVAAPVEAEALNHNRSGTWATIRYALKQSKPVTIIWPNGKVVTWNRTNDS